jgi:seryl-tRNA synthetase
MSRNNHLNITSTPTKNKYIELSSCSNTGLYQTIRCNIKFNDEFAISYNGTFVAIERLLFCLLDNGIVL